MKPKRIFVQKIEDGSPKGRKYRIDVAEDDIVHDVIEKSAKVLKFLEGTMLKAALEGRILEKNSSMKDISDLSLLLISEDDQSKGKNITRSMKTFILIRNGGSKKQKIEIVSDAMVFDIEEKARDIFDIDDEAGIVVSTRDGKTLDPGEPLDKFEESATFLIETDDEIKKTIYVKKQTGKTLKIDISATSTVYDVVEKSRTLLKMNDETDVKVLFN